MILQANFFDDKTLFIIFVALFIGLIVSIVSSSRGKKSDLNLSSNYVEKPITSVAYWIENFLVTIIPIVGFIALIVWSFDDRDKIRKNWAIAVLIFIFLILILFYFLGHLFLTYLMKWIGRFQPYINSQF